MGFASGNGDTDNNSFSIVGDQLFTNVIFDFETKAMYQIRVRSTDQRGSFFEKEFAITIQNSNDAPTGILYSSKTIEENLPKTSLVATLSTTDQDAGDSHSYQLVGGTGTNVFTIENNLLKTTEVLDYEFDSSYTLVVETRDLSGRTFVQTDTILVLDTNDPPSDIILSGTAISENLPTNTLIGRLTATDNDIPFQNPVF